MKKNNTAKPKRIKHIAQKQPYNFIDEYAPIFTKPPKINKSDLLNNTKDPMDTLDAMAESAYNKVVLGMSADDFINDSKIFANDDSLIDTDDLQEDIPYNRTECEKKYTKCSETPLDEGLFEDKDVFIENAKTYLCNRDRDSQLFADIVEECELHYYLAHAISLIMDSRDLTIYYANKLLEEALDNLDRWCENVRDNHVDRSDDDAMNYATKIFGSMSDPRSLVVFFIIKAATTSDNDVASTYMTTAMLLLDNECIIRDI
jgi:hypothetical protein